MTILEAICIFFNLKKIALKKMHKSLCEGGRKIRDFEAMPLKFCKIVYKG